MTPEEINSGPAREAGTPEVPGYPVLLPEEGDPRFSERLLMDVHAVLRAHGYPELGDEWDLEHLELTLHWFLHSEQISERTRALWDLMRSASDGAGLPLGSKRRALTTALLARLEAGQDINICDGKLAVEGGEVSPEEIIGWAPVVLVACTALLAVWVVVKSVRYVRADKEMRRSIRQAVKIRMTWARLAKMAGLSVTDRTPPWLSSLNTSKGAPEPKPRELVPVIKTQPDRYGVIVHIKLLPKVGIKELQDKARFLADAWGCVRVAVEAGKPGHATLRAIRHDPLTGHTQYVPTGEPPTDLTVWPVGRDEYGAPVHIELKNKSGAVVAGGVGGGKSNQLTALITYFGPSPAVQFAVIDGKVSDAAHGDYADVLPRVFAHAGHDLREANALLRRLVKLLHDRATAARKVLGTANMWNVGPSEQWPLVIAIIDESHTFFHDHKGGDKETRALSALAAENVRLTGLLVKGGRSVGIFTVPATQKATGDAIPTSIRDVCSAALSFYQRTTEASVAALGDDIRNWPDMDPINLQGSQYVGVASMAAEGRPGFVRVRTPYLDPASAATVALATAHLTQDPTVLLANLTAPSLRKAEPPEDDAPAAA